MLELFTEFLHAVPTERTVWTGDHAEIQRQEANALEISARMDELESRIRAAREQD